MEKTVLCKGSFTNGWKCSKVSEEVSLMMKTAQAICPLHERQRVLKELMKIYIFFSRISSNLSSLCARSCTFHVANLRILSIFHSCPFSLQCDMSNCFSYETWKHKICHFNLLPARRKQVQWGLPLLSLWTGFMVLHFLSTRWNCYTTVVQLPSSFLNWVWGWLWQSFVHILISLKVFFGFPPCLWAISSIYNSRMCHVMMTRDPLNVITPSSLVLRKLY